jgi:hypothetical protein
MEEQEVVLPLSNAGFESAGSTARLAPKTASGRKLRKWIILLAVWIFAAAYGESYLMRGWIPHDEGAFAQSADRVLRGELPHRDYTEIYTGGLAFLHAFAFRYLGESFATLRIVLFVFFLLWIPAFYWIALRLAPDWIAGSVTVLAVVWSLPNYPAAVPSWYNLFFATFGLAALFAYLRDPSPKWLFVAGVAGGCSFLAKTVALYYVAGVLLSFLFLEQCKTPAEANALKTRSVLYCVLVVASMLLFQGGLALLVREHGGAGEIINLVLPPAILATVILLRELRAKGQTSRERILALLRMILPFGLGFLVPLAVFAVPYIHGNAVHALLTGIFLLPFKRVWGAHFSSPEISQIASSLCLVAILILGARIRGVGRWGVSVTTAGLVAYYLVASAHEWVLYQRLWHAAYWLTPILAVSGALLILSERRNTGMETGSYERQQLFLILAVMTLSGLVQYPFSAPIYFCYVAPLVILGAVSVLRLFPAIPAPLLAVIFGCFLFFGGLRVTPPFIRFMGYQYQTDPETHLLDLPRVGGLRVDIETAEAYEELIPLIQEHAGTGEIFAAPDCPEIYFLAGYRNPTRSLFDFFEDDSRNRKRILRLLDERPIRVIVLNRYPPFSAPMPPDVRQALLARYPYSANIQNFEVRWRQ